MILEKDLIKLISFIWIWILKRKSHRKNTNENENENENGITNDLSLEIEQISEIKNLFNEIE